MKYFPFDQFTFESNLTNEEIITRLNKCIDKRRTFRFNAFMKNDGMHFEGWAKGDEFKINRIINGRNSFLPIIIGSIRSENHRTIINVKMRMHKFVISFLVFWCTCVVFGLLTMSYDAVKKMEINPELFIPFGMLIFAYGLTMFGFKPEVQKAIAFLQDTLKAKTICVNSNTDDNH